MYSLHMGPGYPLSCLFPPLVIHFLFPFLVCFTYFLLLSIPSLSTRIVTTVSRPEVVEGDRTWVYCSVYFVLSVLLS